MKNMRFIFLSQEKQFFATHASNLNIIIDILLSKNNFSYER
jgi:hypothetical protein